MRILIDDHKREFFPLPWKYDGTCYNFMSPDRFMEPNAIEIKRPSYVESLVIGCDLEDYSFIAKCKNIRQLYIYSGKNLRDLSFMENLVYLEHICICRSEVISAKPLLNLIDKKYELFNRMSEDEKLTGRLRYQIDGLYLQSSQLIEDASKFIKANICKSDIVINRKKPYQDNK